MNLLPRTALRTTSTALLRLPALLFATWAVLAGGATLDCSTGWRFHLGDAPGAEASGFDDAAWETVALPHPARLEARVTDHGTNQQWEGVCWYRKVLALPPEAAGQTVRLRFEGAMNEAVVFANGQEVARSLDGYLPVVADLSDVAAAPDPVVIAVRLDNRHSAVTGPKPLPLLDFHLYHGLYRTASLTIQPPLHITDEALESRVASGGVFVTYPLVSAESATVAVQTHVRNRGADSATFAVRATLLDRTGAAVAAAESDPVQLAAGADRAVPVRLEVKQPRLWSPAAPHLHELVVALVVDGRAIDSRTERIGLRRIEAGPRGLVINGAPLFLRGVNRHQEYPYLGNALPANAQYRDAWKIKAAGFDCIRLSHYPHSPDFMAACDELGLVVFPGILGWQYHPGTPEFEANRVAAARALVRRDRNHPSAVLWEVSLNETPMTPAFIARLQAAAHEEYPGDQMITAGWADGYDVKFTARQHGSTQEFARAVHPCFVSEYGDWEYYAQNAGFNQENWGNLKEAERNSRQARGDGEARLLQQAANVQEAHNENRGTQALGDGYWVMFDYNRGYAPDLETSGVMDLFRLPKFSHYFYQSQRDAGEAVAPGLGGPMVFIASWWTPDSPLAVRVFSNGEEVELRLNGRSLGRQRPDQNRFTPNLAHPPFTFRVPVFEPGELQAVAYRDGQPVATHVVRTPGAPHRLVLSIDESGRPFAAGGDVVFLYAAVVDAQGTVVSGAATPVTFTVEGAATVVGDNPSAAEAGIATILLKSGAEPAILRITASAGELRGELTVNVAR